MASMKSPASAIPYSELSISVLIWAVAGYVQHAYLFDDEGGRLPNIVLAALSAVIMFAISRPLKGLNMMKLLPSSARSRLAIIWTAGIALCGDLVLVIVFWGMGYRMGDTLPSHIVGVAMGPHMKFSIFKVIQIIGIWAFISENFTKK